jgi:hypothetical protein
MTVNKNAFFDEIRHMWNNKLPQEVVTSIDRLLSSLPTDIPLAYMSYSLATAYHETARTMMPVTEYGPRSYFDKYEPGTKIGKDLGNTKKGDGYKFRGRGFVQLTGRRNYEFAGAKLKIDLVGDPEKACDWSVARKIMREGMLNGWFTGKKASDYLDGKTPDYVNARRIINGTDKAKTIAGYAETFEKAFREAGWAP